MSRGLITTSAGDNGDRSSSSSESQHDEYDEDTVAALRSAFAADDGAGTKESMVWMQREVQRKLQEQIEVSDRPNKHHSKFLNF